MADDLLTLAARVAAAQALAAAATKPPWSIVGAHNDYWIQSLDGGSENGWPTGEKIVQLETWKPATKRANADLMAAAPDLVALVTDLWAEVRREGAAASEYRLWGRRREQERDDARDEAAAIRSSLRPLAQAIGIAMDGSEWRPDVPLLIETVCREMERAWGTVASLRGERDEARAEITALRALLTRDGTAWGEHCAGLGEPTTTEEDTTP